MTQHGDKPKILVTGATGFIGSHMVKYLKDQGHYVRGTRMGWPESRAHLFGMADDLHFVNLNDYDSALQATHNMDMVIHLASRSGGIASNERENYKNYRENLNVDNNVIDACVKNGVKRLFYASSSYIYSEDQDICYESRIFPAKPQGQYGWNKLQGLLHCEYAPIDARVGVLFPVYGPYQDMRGEREKFTTAIVRRVLYAKAYGSPIEIWGNGKQLRSYLHVDNAVDMIYRVLSSEEYSGPVNIAGETFSVREVAETACRIVDARPSFQFHIDKPTGPMVSIADKKKFQDLYGGLEYVSLKDGLTQLIYHAQLEK